MDKAVLLLTFNRLDTTKKVFAAIKKAKPKRLYISSDGPRSNKKNEDNKINLIRDYLITNINWKCQVKTLFREKNLGCRNSVSSAITWFFNYEKDGIILEDDCVPSDSFFVFCSELLEKYKNNLKIMHISGSCLAPNFIDNSSYHFLKIQHCWGWATWANRWKYYGKNLVNFNETNLIKFSKKRSVQNYWGKILQLMKNNEIDSWAYQWAFKIVENNGLCINPSVNLVSNIGFSNDSTHTTDTRSPLSNILAHDFKKIIHPSKIILDSKAVNYTYKNVYNISIHSKKYKNLTDKVETLNKELTSLSQQNTNLLQELDKIRSSSGWKILVRLYSIRDQIFPSKSIPMKLFKKIYIAIKRQNNYPKTKIYRNINLNSKKIVYIGHSYHAKTKSTRFLIDFLKKHFDVTEILDESWQGKPYPDLSFVDENYLGIIMFQNIPSPQIVNSLKNQNIIFFPMYDGHGNSPFEFWNQYRNLKIINFSKTLHNKLKKWGFDSIYLQYFPKPSKQKVNKENKIFLWQRTDKIDINLVEKLIGNLKTKIHIHKAIDPKFKFTQPTKKQEKKFKITYSSWFPSRKEMTEVLSSCNIYIAPRELEGIGLSFLEAMAMGKVIIASNNPTMNEYIIHNQNGYLYDIINPQPIDFYNFENIKKVTLKFVKNGNFYWENNKKNIIELIKKQ